MFIPARQGRAPGNSSPAIPARAYVDTTPLATPGVAETREYRVRGVINDVEIGDYSDVKIVAVQ